jgi:hypothetical protein
MQPENYDEGQQDKHKRYKTRSVRYEFRCNVVRYLSLTERLGASGLELLRTVPSVLLPRRNGDIKSIFQVSFSLRDACL